MKKSSLRGFTVLFLLMASSFQPKNHNFPKAKDIQKELIAINDKAFLGKYEVSNGQYRQFLAYLERTGKEKIYNASLPDTTLWVSAAESHAMKDYYFSAKAYEDFPVVTVSYEGANAYCHWLSVHYNGDARRKFKKVVFRLPTEREWVEAANGGDRNKLYPWNHFYLRDGKGAYLCNFLRLGDQAIYYDSSAKAYKIAEDFIGEHNRGMLLASVNAFRPSPAGFYNLSGNAAEMVAEKGLAKGGSYRDPGYDVRISSRKYYSSPSTEIGFRVLMEVVEK